ncbi:MAG: ferritin-like domain-containing protein [Anaerolineae bacterium]|jgi:bacterioferritin
MSVELISLLNQAIAREMQVSIQYIAQHCTAVGEGAAVPGRTPSARRAKFVASNWPVWLPGSTLKQIAITEMKHAEAIIERVVVLGGEPATEPSPITVGTTIEEMLALDREQEREAIELYRRIIGVARDEGDDVTMNLFEQILSDEQAHHRTFSDLIEED